MIKVGSRVRIVDPKLDAVTVAARPVDGTVHVVEAERERVIVQTDLKSAYGWDEWAVSIHNVLLLDGEGPPVLTPAGAAAPVVIDAVQHPPHYGGADNPYETIKVIDAWGLGFNLGNTVKYISRAGKKSGATLIEDLRKARFYLDHEIQRLEGAKK